jgi:hypothetical protein
MNTTLLFHFFVLLYFFSGVCFGQNTESKNKINGISIWSDVTPRQKQDFAFIEKTNANWVSLQPYGVIWTDTSGVEFDQDTIWECSTNAGLIKNIGILHELGYKIFLKPHLIVKYEKPGVWVGNLKLDSEKKWQIYERSYAKFVTNLASIADSMGVELFSLGTELGTFPEQRTEYWTQLIDSVRSIYSGGLTYCANFDAYHEFPLWEKFDIMGIDAYFTIENAKNPTLDNCRDNWEPIAEKLKAFSNALDKKILFAEFGYHSADYCALKPFGLQSANVNLVAQANAYRAVFDIIWNEPWFVGGFSWIWRFDNDQPENYDNTFYSPQNKPAADIIAKVYQLYR